MFDQIIQEIGDRFGLGDKASPLVHGLVGMMTSKSTGGLQGFLNAFEKVGMGSAVRSWVGTGESEAIGAEQVEAALGDGISSDLADKLDLDRGVVGTALAFLVPRLVDLLTPDAKVPSHSSIMERLGGFLDGAGAAVAGVGAVAGDVAKDATGAAGAAVDKTGDALRGAAAGTQRMTGEALDGVGNVGRKSGASLRWLLPLLLLALVLWWFARSCPSLTGAADVGATGDGAEIVETATGSDTAAEAGDGAADGEGALGAIAGRAKAAGEHVVDGAANAVDTAADGARSAVDAAAAGTAQAGTAVVDAAEAAGDAVVDGTRAAADEVAAGAAAVRDGVTQTQDGTAGGTSESADEAGVGTNAGTAAGAAEAPQPAVDTGAGEFNPAMAVEQATRASRAAIGSMADGFSTQQLVDALNLSIVNFASGSSAIPADSRDLLREAAGAMQELAAAARIEIGGHTDSTGSAAVNEALSADRAKAVKEALVGYGAPAEMLSARGYGSSQPVASNDTAEGRFRNRRIGYRVVD